MTKTITLVTDPTAKIADNFFYATKSCPTCSGEGEVPETDYKDPTNRDKVEKYKKPCTQCKGTKRVKK